MIDSKIEAAVKRANSLTDSSVRTVVRDELHTQQTTNHIMAVLSKTDIDSRVATVVSNKVPDEVEKCLPALVTKKTETYLTKNLDAQVQKHVIQELPRLLPNYVPTAVMNVLSERSGVEHLLQLHYSAVGSQLQAHQENFATRQQEYLLQIQSARHVETKACDTYLTARTKEFKVDLDTMLKEQTEAIVKGDQGSILKAYKDDLKKAVDAHVIDAAQKQTDAFAAYKQEVTKKYEKAQKRNDSLSRSLTMMGSLNVVMIAAIGALFYLRYR